jgi:hypothetical protein
MIETVKIQGSGYLLNGTMSVPTANGNREYEAIKQWLGEGNTPLPEFTEEELQAKAAAEATRLAKQAKELALQAIKVTTQSGKVFDGRDIDQQRMVSAIISADVVGLTETYWKLTDNSVAMVTLDELKEALSLSIQALGVIIMTEVVV